jgi:hypothetical protein
VDAGAEVTNNNVSVDRHICTRAGIALVLAILYEDDELKAAILEEMGIDNDSEADTEDAAA